MTQAEFWSSTLRQVLAITDARRSAEQDRERGEWERARWISTAITRATLAPHSKAAAKIQPTDLIRFAWEEEEEQPEKPNLDAAAIFAKWDAHNEKMKNGGTSNGHQ